MSKAVKARHWAFVAYPESVPADWLDTLKLSGLKCAISPLHDRDTHSDPAIEDGKKPHWHVIVSWENTTTYNAVVALTQRLNATSPVKLESVRGYYRYFTHADDPDKYQYDPADIQHLGGFDILDHIEMTMSERIAITKRIQNFIREHDIVEYADLLDTLLDADEGEMYAVAIGNTLLFRGYIQSRAAIAYRTHLREEQREENERERQNRENFAADDERVGKQIDNS